MLNQDFPLRNVLVALPRPPLPAFTRRVGPVGRHFRLIFLLLLLLNSCLQKLSLLSFVRVQIFSFPPLFFSLLLFLWPLSSLSLSSSFVFSFECFQERRKKKFYPLPPALSSYPRKSDRLPKFPFDLFRAERVEQNLYGGIHRYPTGLTRGKRLKDAGGRMRVWTVEKGRGRG